MDMPVTPSASRRRGKAQAQAVLLTLVGGVAFAATEAPLGWGGGFTPPGLLEYPTVFTLCSFRTPAGPWLMVGGQFGIAGRVDARDIAAWTGTHWVAAPAPFWLDARSMIVFDFGAGPRLCVGGAVGGVWTWDGATWASLPGMVAGQVDALAAYDDGTGAALYIGGTFCTINNQPVLHLARWDGSGWREVGGGLGPNMDDLGVYALAVFDDGRGAALYVGGDIWYAGGSSGLPIGCLARWDGHGWDDVGGGVSDGFDPRVLALHTYDDGTGPALLVGGKFFRAGDGEAHGVARWDGVHWTALPGVDQGEIDALEVLPEPGGPTLVAGGYFDLVGGASPCNVAAWRGSGWTQLGGGTDDNGIWAGVHALAVHDSGHGPRLYVGGLFNIAGGVPATGIARLEGERFAPVTPGAAPNSYASCGLVRREGGADILYCGGNFYTAGEQVAGPLARWDGARWSAIEPLPPFGGVSALGEFDDGTGPVLFVSGSTGFDPNDPHNNLNGLARFDGHAWSGVGGGLTGVTGAKASALAVFDDGTGPALYVGGRFRQAGAVAASSIARWDGLNWSALGSGVTGGPPGLDPTVEALAVFDAGDGAALFVGGNFNHAGGTPAKGLARWDGARWTGVAGGLTKGGAAGLAAEFLVYDDGRGSALYLVGGFDHAGNVAAWGIARWDGQRFWALGAGLTKYEGPASAGALAAYDDGRGPALYVAGDFDHAGNVPARNIAKWDGQRWSALGSGIESSVGSLFSFRDRDGPGLYALGGFLHAGGRVSAYVARWGPLTNAGDLNCDGTVDWRDVNPFVLVLSDRAEYEERYPECDARNGDCNGDERVDFGDINPFVALLGGG